MASSISEMVAMAKHTLQVFSMRQFSNLLSRFLISTRPENSAAASENRLPDLIYRALESFFLLNAPRYEVAQQIRAIVALFTADVSIALREQAFDTLEALFAMLHWDVSPLEIPDDNDPEEESKNEAIVSSLVDRYGISRQIVERLPGLIARSLQAALSSQPPPTCPISLESILDPESERIRSGIVALTEAVRRDGTIIRFHVYLYDRELLNTWFTQSGFTNPLTRDRIHAQSQLFDLS